jgi:hypothetical protein
MCLHAHQAAHAPQAAPPSLLALVPQRSSQHSPHLLIQQRVFRCGGPCHRVAGGVRVCRTRRTRMRVRVERRRHRGGACAPLRDERRGRGFQLDARSLGARASPCAQAQVPWCSTSSQAVNAVSKSDKIKENEGNDESYMRECRCVLLCSSSESNIESDEHMK